MDNLLLLVCFCGLMILSVPSVTPTSIVRIRHIGPRAPPSRGPTASESKQIMIKVKPSDSLPVGRVMPNMPSSMSESKILRLKPVVLKFHKDKKPNSTAPVDVDKLYNALQDMGLNKMAVLLRQVNLGEELLRSEPLTLFSPTDEAFSLAPRGFVQTLLQDDNQETLWNVLLHHVIRGHMQAEDVRNDFTMPTPHHTGAPLRFNIYAGGQVVTVNGAQFLYNVRDVDGVLIQAIDRVLYPLAESNMIDKLKNDFHEMHTTLLKAGLSDQLSSGTFTVFSPRDEAFSILPQEARDTLLTNSTLLRKLALNHIVPGTYFSAALSNGFSAKPLGGNILLFTSRRGMILVNGVPIMEPDQITENGVIHGINRVLVPEDLIQQCKCMQSYPSMPATLRPTSTTSGVKDGSDPENTLGVPFGTRIKTAFTGDLPSADSTAPGATEGPGQDDDEPPPEWPETTDTPRPLIGMLSDPIRLPDGRRATFTTSNNLFRNSVFLSRIRHPGTSGMTILLPTDRAFRRLPPAAMDQLRNDPARLKSTLGMHILEGRIDPKALVSGVPIRTVSGRTLMVNVLPQRRGLIIGGVPILAVRSGTNGAVFVVDRMVEPSQPIGVDQIVKVSPPATPADTDELSIWRGIIDDVPDLKNQLKSRDRFYTMFAPTNAAFYQLPPDHLKRLLDEEQLKRDLIRSHVMTGALSRNLLNPDLVAPSLKGNKLRFHRMGGAFEVNSVPVYRRPIVTSNGVVFIVERLLFSPITSRSLEPPEEKTTDAAPETPSLEEIALRYNATTFLKWIHASGLRDTIKAHAPCALILPSNAAIDRMSPTLRMIAVTNRRALQRLVKYHVFTTPRVWPSFEANEWTLPTLLPNIPLRINVYKNNTLLTFSGCPVEEMMRSKDRIDVAIVNNTMSPPVGDLALTMSKSPLLRNFTKIVKVSGLDLKGKSGPYTIFAPTKCAFETMTPELYHELITNPDAAKDFVQRHIVKGTTFTKGMYDGQKMDDLAGNHITISIPPDCIHVNDARMRYGDLGATNGVIHILDRVL